MSDELLRVWGNNVTQFRKMRGLSVNDFAMALGVSQATVSRWESGKMAPRDARKVDIATVLNVDVQSIFPLVRVG